MHEQKRYQASVLKYDTDAKKHAPFPWKRLIWIVSIVAFFAGIVVLIRLPKFQVHTVNVIGTNVADPVDVSQFVMGSLQGNSVFILPRTSILLVSTVELTKKIQDHFPRFKTVLVERDSMDSLKVTVSEYGGVYLWCDHEDVCSFMDMTGTVFADAPYFSGSAYTKIYIGERAPYPFHPISTEELALVIHLKEQLAKIEINPISFSFESEHKISVSFIHHTSHANIYIDPTKDIDNALETLYSGLRTEPMVSLYRSPLKVLEYIDLRFANKLIYKFQ